VTVASPCTGICRLEPMTGRCLGCRRTAEEITAWPDSSDAEKHRILAALPARQRRYGAGGVANGR
jgi:predicted Fe-S protein YdhL (DUF1289 family)